MSTRRGLIALGLLLAVGGPQAVQAQQQRPSLNAGRVAGEVLVGTYTGIGGYFVGHWVGQRVSDAAGVSSEDTRRRLSFATGVTAAGLVTAGTVYGIGNIGDETGDFAATYLGSGAGFVVAWGLSRVLLGPEERPKHGSSTAGRWIVANVIASLPAIGATVGFNSSRRFR